eukprot:CFRG6400T1
MYRQRYSRSRVSRVWGRRIIYCGFLIFGFYYFFGTEPKELRAILSHVKFSDPKFSVSEGAVENVGLVVEKKPIVTKDHEPLVVLYTGGGVFNTGIWPGWAGDDPNQSILNWAAAGVEVEKHCPYQCKFTHDNNEENMRSADAVVMELINFPKFIGKEVAKRKGIPWPPKRGEKTPLLYNFFYEPAIEYYDYTINPDLNTQIDATLSPLQNSTLPITLVCPWGRGKDAYAHRPPKKNPKHKVAYFNEHGIAPENVQFVEEFMKLMGENNVDRYIHMRNKELPPEAVGNPYQLENRLKFLGTYKFHIVTEPIIYPDWVEPEWSHTLIAGSVPIYFGAPNIEDYSPGPKSFINGNSFESPKMLASFIKVLLHNDNAYNEYFEWKKAGPTQKFAKHVENCAHYAECRICEHIYRNW